MGRRLSCMVVEAAAVAVVVDEAAEVLVEAVEREWEGAGCRDHRRR